MRRRLQFAFYAIDDWLNMGSSAVELAYISIASLFVLLIAVSVYFFLENRELVRKIDAQTSDIRDLTTVSQVLVRRFRSISALSGEKTSLDLLQAFTRVALITAEKANLRTSPTDTSPTVMEVAKGSKLSVKDETREWFKVWTPAGRAAWVSKSVAAIKGEAHEG